MNSRRVESRTLAAYHSNPVFSRRQELHNQMPEITQSSGNSPIFCVGRENELGMLTQSHTQAKEHGERFVLVEGPAAMGKSRILKEFQSRTRLSGGIVLEGRCDPGRPFGPFIDIVDQVLRFLEEVSATISTDLSGLSCRAGCHRLWHLCPGSVPILDAGFAPATQFEALEKRLTFFDSIHGLLRDVSTVRAPVILLHDLDRADQGTIQLLEYILEGAGPWTGQLDPNLSLNALFVASVRTAEPNRRQDPLQRLRALELTKTIAVGELTEDGVREYLQNPAVVEHVLQRTKGVPESIALLLDSDPLSPEIWLSRQLKSLPEDAAAMVGTLAVLRHPADIELLSSIAEVEASPATCSAVRNSAVLSQNIVDGRILFSFEREAVRERAYAMIPTEQRAQFHRKCARVLRKHPSHSEQATRHALLAGDTDEAVELALEDTQSLVARHAHQSAASLLEHVLAGLVGEAPIAVHETLSELYRIIADYKKALDHALLILKRLPEDALAARRVGNIQTLAGEFEDATKNLELARNISSQNGDDTETRQAEALLAELHYQRSSYEEAEMWAQRALAGGSGEQAVSIQIHARNTIGKVALATRQLERAAELFDTNRRLAAETNLGHQQAQALTNYGVAMLRRQRLDDAEAAFARAITAADNANDLRDRAIATENLAVLAHLRRDFDTALRHYQTAVQLLKRIGNKGMLARVANSLCELYLSLGEGARARALSDFAHHLSQNGLSPSRAAEVKLFRAQVELADGNTKAARRMLEEAHTTFASLGSNLRFDATLALTELALVDGDVERAKELLHSCEDDAESARVATELAIAWVDTSRAAGEGILEAARNAVSMADVSKDPELQLKAYIRLAEAELDAEDVTASATALQKAQRTESELGARVPEESRTAWLQRRDRKHLERVDAMVSAAYAKSPTRTNRISTLPEPMPGSGPGNGRTLQHNLNHPNIVGTSPHTLRLLSTLDKVAPTDTMVLIRGESGTGKELVAEALHQNSKRRERALVKVNCAALVETLLMSELFGHERGAFTGANARKKGRFELADGGTIFLDEIGDISPKMQVSLLRVLQEREFERVGGTQSIQVDVRIIAATHRNLEQMVSDGLFREDLYYRLRGVSIEIAPLRERVQDLPAFCEHLLARIARERGDGQRTTSKEAIGLLMKHSWPGNVRELENVLRSATLFADDQILQPDDFSAFSDSFTAPTAAFMGNPRNLEEMVYERVREGETSLLEIKKVLERECIVRALSETNGNITKAAALLGMKRPRLSQLAKQYKLSQSS